MKRILKDAYHVVKKWIIKIRVRYKLYFKENIENSTDWSLLYDKCPYNNPNCVSNDFLNMSDDEKILLSIIVPLYNSTPYIQKLVSMLGKQETRYNYEVLFIDDGSVDDTVKIVRDKIASFPNMKLITQVNTGIGGARNKGLDFAVGKYVAFMDHDDEIEMCFVEKLLFTAIEKDLKTVKCQYGQKINGRLAYTQISSGFVWGGIYKRSMFYKVRFPVGYWYEDMINPFLLGPQDRNTKYIDDVLYYSNYTGNNASKVMWRDSDYRCLQQIYLCKELIDGYKKLGYNDDLYLMEKTIKECGILGSNRMKKIDINTKKNAFIACCELFDTVNYNGKYFMNNIEYKVLKDRDFAAWCLLAELA